jgi:hypothetical protein
MLSSPVDNLWTTRQRYAQLIHIFAMYLTCRVRSIRSQRAPKAGSSRVRLVLLGVLCLCIGSLSITMQPVQAATKTDYLKLYAHKKIIDSQQYKCFYWIITKESRWNPNARNGSHYGLGQMRSTWYKTLDPYRQIDATIKYITKRYTDPCKAKLFHERKGWY